jgi:DNA-binding response OmpR family regulator
LIQPVKTQMKILLIEDDEDDVELLQEALNTNSVPFEMQVIRDGSEAIEFVRTCDVYPDVIVMDFNLPKVHGKVILKEIKAAEILKDMPLIVLTTSSSKEDENYAYEMGAHKFLIKPVTLEQMKHTATVIVDAATLKKDR